MSELRTPARKSIQFFLVKTVGGVRTGNASADDGGVHSCGNSRWFIHSFLLPILGTHREPDLAVLDH